MTPAWRFPVFGRPRATALAGAGRKDRIKKCRRRPIACAA